MYVPLMASQPKVRLKEGFVKMAEDKKPTGVAIIIAPKKPEAPMPAPSDAAQSEILDQMQTNRNNKAATGAPRTMKKGGCTKMARGGGIEIRGKTKGRFV